MRRASLALLVFLSVMPLTACYQTFAIYYLVPKERRLSPQGMQDLADQLDGTLRPFGFKRYDDRAPDGTLDMVEFDRARSSALLGACNLSGYENRLGVALDMDVSDSWLDWLDRGNAIRPIFFRDAGHTKETAFDRAVLQAIEKVLQEQYSIAPQRERSLDLFY